MRFKRLLFIRNSKGYFLFFGICFYLLDKLVRFKRLTNSFCIVETACCISKQDLSMLLKGLLLNVFEITKQSLFLPCVIKSFKSDNSILRCWKMTFSHILVTFYLFLGFNPCAYILRWDKVLYRSFTPSCKYVTCTAFLYESNLAVKSDTFMVEQKSFQGLKLYGNVS